MAEACGVPVGQLLPDGIQVFLRIGELLTLAAGVGHTANQLVLAGQPLLAQVVDVEVALVVSRPGSTAQAEAVVLSLSDISVNSVILGDRASVFPAIFTHGGQVFQWPILPHSVHKLLQDLLEFRRVEAVAIVRPPGMVESFPA